MASSFDDLQLDPKLLQSLRKKGFATPTPVQAACIPEALSGKDLVAQARTGTGKTLAYVLPALHRILAGSSGSAGWQALILVPTRELCEQVKHLGAASPLARVQSAWVLSSCILSTFISPCEFLRSPLTVRTPLAGSCSHRLSKKHKPSACTAMSRLQCGQARVQTLCKPMHTELQASLLCPRLEKLLKL